MTAIDMHSAVQLASDGLITVLDAQLPTELAAVKLATFNAAMPLDAPSKYFEVLTEARVDTEVRSTGRVACFVYQSDSYETDEIVTGDGNARYSIGRTQWSVVVAFHTAVYEPWAKPWDATENVTSEEVMVERARAYAGGVIQCLLKYGCSQSGIEGIELVDNEPGSVDFNEDGRPIIGYSHTTFDILQYVNWPSPQALP